jgi:hypothetical protein
LAEPHRIDIEQAVEEAVINMLDDPAGRDWVTERDDLLSVIYAWQEEQTTSVTSPGDMDSKGQPRERTDSQVHERVITPEQSRS